MSQIVAYAMLHMIRPAGFRVGYAGGMVDGADGRRKPWKA